MPRKLNATVTVIDDDGTTHVFGPDDEVPAEFLKRITNPDVWDDEAGSTPSSSSTDEDGDDEDDEDDTPRKGRRRS